MGGAIHPLDLAVRPMLKEETGSESLVGIGLAILSSFVLHISINSCSTPSALADYNGTSSAGGNRGSTGTNPERVLPEK